MNETSAYRSEETDEESLVKHGPEETQITVRTEIKITQGDNESTECRSAHQSVEPLKL